MGTAGVQTKEVTTTHVRATLCLDGWWWWCVVVVVVVRTVQLMRCVCPYPITDASNYGDRVPVDTAPGPVPVHRALKNPPRNSSNLGAKTLSMSCN